MKLFLGSEGKQEIEATILKMIEEFQLEPQDMVYFHIEKKADFDILLKELERSTLNCIE